MPRRPRVTAMNDHRPAYGMKVLWLSTGEPMRWHHPPAPDKMVGWSKKTVGGDPIKGSFRTICHMDRLNRLIYRKWNVGLQVIQSDWNTSVAASAGTHDFDATWDVYIPGVDWWTSQRFLRRNGFACWYRHPPMFGYHIHGFTLPQDGWHFHPKVGVYVDGGVSSRGARVTSSQIEDYHNHAFGLADQHTPGSDRSWFPRDISKTIFDLDKYIENRRREEAA